MVDIVDSSTRSKMMSAIKGRDTTPEILVRRFLHRAGLRYRLHPKTLPGKPDIVLSRWKTVVLVNGCFWHRHQDCRFATTPSTRTSFWEDKFSKNVQRDNRQIRELQALGWKVLVVWECEVKDENRLQRLLNEIRDTGQETIASLKTLSG